MPLLFSQCVLSDQLGKNLSLCVYRCTSLTKCSDCFCWRKQHSDFEMPGQNILSIQPFQKYTAVPQFKKYCRVVSNPRLCFQECYYQCRIDAHWLFEHLNWQWITPPPLPPPSPWGYNSAAIEYRDTSRTHARIPVHASTHTGARKGRTHTCAHRHTDARKGRTHTHTHACALRSQHNTAHWVPPSSNYYLLCCSSLTKNTHLRLKWDRGVFLFSWKF